MRAAVPPARDVRRCPEHHAQYRARRAQAKKQSGRNLASWQKLRAAVLERDGHMCRLRLDYCQGRATSVHLDPRLRGDHRLATMADCVSACSSCHGAAHAGKAPAAARAAQ